MSLDFGDFLENSRYADVEFIVKSDAYSASKTFKAHKQLLALRSDVFGAMFYGSLRERDTVLIQDLNPDGFRGLLKYVYTGRPAINNIEDAMYTRSAADKYLFNDLKNICTKYINDHLKADNVCKLIDYSFVANGEVIDDVVEQVIQDNAASVLSSAEFTLSMEQTVNFVLDRVPGVPAKVVIMAVYRWAVVHCSAEVASCDPSGRVANAVRPFLPKLKFLALSPRQMTKFVTAEFTRDILSKEEAFAILCEIIEPGTAVALPEWLNPEGDVYARPKSSSREPPCKRRR
ncbi:hypothetical protein HPB49_020454 [Dermacentor silvarum]|uniref:Uncharacterized protein n=1 Tax=Dermacentor silvarum TaxID=543639 RepID=A0ACB8CHF4_DERSI|nr:hypothetical protein HPB49_020454 [Dermacentor silvarum]